ncbi:tRNA lysidine(34) synthetase TilS [Psychromonas sp. psych-6C06]|uniref:tRNA lysidine(34) synthetase TilS n=1 Tax=Psychromonas sp. psych-6C06 TaxID=2058089 RepID=UPI000C31EB88|nr:tRNA lysidine(34) synthetase TilS [Psychromonas sp. psych-6C06]PKF62866.1 tRNA lysidine(34) synthetase TilS [Psychromonas sp. psych-6C06]
MEEVNNHDVFIAFKAQLALLAPTQAQFKIALSGGLDSMVLLHLFSRLENCNVVAQHIHHGLSPYADDWAEQCRITCASLGIPFIFSKVTLDKKNGESLEALARDKRYQALTHAMSKDHYLVTGHHQDDQLETVLLALKRGAGLTGLQGIVGKQCLSMGYLVRPLLDFSREQLSNYAQQFSLTWVEDESNQDQQFDRNFIRQSITPLLKARWPAITKTVARSAIHCQSQQQLIDEITVDDFKSCNSKLKSLRIQLLKNLSQVRRCNVIRHWFKQNGLTYPSTKQLAAIWQDVVIAQQDAMPQISLQGYNVCRYRDELYLVSKNKVTCEAQRVSWHATNPLKIKAGDFRFHINAESGYLDERYQVDICFRSDLPKGFSCRPIGRDKKRTIKKLFHEHHLAPWLRDRLPFVFINGELVEATSLFQCESVYSKQLRICSSKWKA